MKFISAMTKNNQLDQTDEATDIPSDYYDQLRWSADDLFELGLGVVPSADQIVTRNEYEGYDEFDKWRASRFDENTNPDRFGLRGYEISGQWSTDRSVFYGYYSVTLDRDGDIRLNNWYVQFTQEEIHRQIDLAEDSGFLLGISANTFSHQNVLNPERQKPNTIIQAPYDLLQSLAPIGGTRIDSDGNSCWSYCHLDVTSGKGFNEFIKPHEECQFWSSNANGDDGWISLLGKAPCYPSIVDGYSIQLLNSPARKQIIYAAAPSDLRIQFINAPANLACTSASPSFSATDLLSEYEIEDDGTWNGCLTPDEEEEFFASFVREQEENRIQIVRKKPVVNSVPEANSIPEADERVKLDDDEITLHDIFPKQIADALVALSEHLPYDPISIAVTFLTALAGMLRLGTLVEGNAATGFRVPINFYTAIVAGSGRKKTPLQNIFAKQPAEDVLLKVARENENVYRAWAKNPGKKDEKPPKPIPLDLKISDYTAEALVITLGKSDEFGRSILVSRDEINGLFKSLGQYKPGKGADEEQLLEIYDGGSFRSLRIGDTTRSFERCSVNILGAVQPEILIDLLSGGDASGKWARFIIVPIPDLIKKLPIIILPEMQARIDCAAKLLKDVFSSVYELSACIYKLDAEALGLFTEYEYGRQDAIRNAKVSAQSSLYGKSAGKVLRLAGILHILWNLRGGARLAASINSEILYKAIRLVEYTDNWMLALHLRISGKGGQKLDKFARRIHEICLKSQSRLSWTEIRNQMSSEERKGKTTHQAEESMRLLESLDVGEVSSGPKGGLCYKALKPLPQYVDVREIGGTMISPIETLS